MSHGIIIPATSKDVRTLTARHESRHYEPESDECTFMICDDEFLQDVERSGNKRKFLKDLGFDMDDTGGDIERIPVNLDKGYDRYDAGRLYDANGLRVPSVVKREQGRGKGSIIFQGAKHED